MLDFKRGDIGNTNSAYAKFAFEYLDVDAVTLQPYQGIEALQPFLDYKNKGIFILCKTSNPGSEELQDVSIVAGLATTLYQHVARQVLTKWNANKNCLLVVGATYPDQLSKVRKLVGDMTILVPGIGSQGGDLEKTLKAGLANDKRGLIINSSRSIIFSDNPRKEAQKMKSSINLLRNRH